MPRNYSNIGILMLLQRIDDGYQPTAEEHQTLRERTELDLSDTQITTLPESIGQLSNLQTLDLWETQITVLPESIGQLTELQTLDLSDTQITVLPESIGQLAKLKDMFLSDNQIAVLPESIGQLTELQALDLSHTQITSLPESIGQLAKLQELVISDTPITALPESIGHLTNLQKLFLLGTKITALPKSIGQLANLQWLDLCNLQITALPESIGQLANLQRLNLRDTQITTLPESVGQLSNLQDLNLTGIQVTALPDSLWKLTQLRSLALGGTGITELPEYVRGFSKLEKLYIWKTKITALPEWIGELSSLQYLSLYGLTLPAIPESLALRGLPFVEKEDDYGIVLEDVTLTQQDKSIFLEHPELIPSLYQKEQITLRECRVIFLGDGAAGKSYTIRRFRNEGKPETADDPYVTSETPGVEILDYDVKRGADSFTVHFWDFGGQQLLHSMHRCFLTDETCYVVMVKTRETKANDRARYWLRNVEAFAPNSPILLFVNCWENDDGRRSIDEPGLRDEFPNIQDVIYCSAKQANEAAFRETVMGSIIDLAASSEGLTRQVPAQWVRVREAIEAESAANNYLDRNRYHALCAQNGVENEHAPALLSYFNTLGVCFSFHRDREKKELTAYKLLNPVWLTNAIYAVIEEGRVHAKEGRIGRDEIKQMLCNPAPETVQGKTYRRTVPELTYKPYECPFILDVAIAFDLCYPVDDNTLFFPALCSTDTPKEALSAPEGFGQHVSYQLRYSYLPDSVLHQLMVRCMRNSLSVSSAWLRGMVLHVWNLHRVFVRMTDDETLRIDVYSTGEHRAYALFWALRKQIEEINEKLGLKATEFILDGKNVFSLGAVLGAARNNADVYDQDGNAHNARKLLGEFYEESFTQTMQMKDGSIVIPLIKREYHKQAKKDQVFRSALYEAYNRICPYCGQTIQSIQEMEVDHILATHHQELPALQSYLKYLASCGFDITKPDYLENYFPTHPHCNRRKSDRINEFSLPYWHDLAAQHVPRILDKMEKYKKQQK